MKKGLIILVIVGLVIFGLNMYAYAKPHTHNGTVKDNNNGVAGEAFFIHSGQVQGNYNDIGTWTNAEFLKGDKGEQGIKGEKGNRGYMGLQGEQGIQGNAGSDANVTHRYTDGVENQIENYGYNDFYSENAFKNNLINEGYSKVFDYDDPNLDLTEVSYFGRVGNPDVIDVDYVLTSEYEKYSSQGQDIRIENNKGYIIDNSNRITDNADEIEKVESESIYRNSNLQNNINNETSKRKQADRKERRARIKGDQRLNSKIKVNRSNITTNKKNIKVNKNKIVDVDNKHTTWNNNQDTKIVDNTSGISHNSRRINDNVKRLDNHEGRIGDLEDTSYCVRGELQFVRKENLIIGVYGKTDLRHSDINNEVGINIVVGIGKSESQEKREALEKRIENLEKKLGYIGVDTIVTRNEKGYIIAISEQDKMRVLKKF